MGITHTIETTVGTRDKLFRHRKNTLYSVKTINLYNGFE